MQISDLDGKNVADSPGMSTLSSSRSCTKRDQIQFLPDLGIQVILKYLEFILAIDLNGSPQLRSKIK